MKVLVTGAAGFIGYHTVKALLDRGDAVVGLDCVNDYYDPTLKEARLRTLQGRNGWLFMRGDLADLATTKAAFADHRFDRVIHLAAQAGVRHSLSHPHEYVQSNLVAFINLVEACRHHKTPHLTYASTSSVYGANGKLPFSEHDGADHPLQLYAATKRANELMAHAYSHLFGLPTTALRFFTVYGPWGRPDMALFLFTRNILAGEPIKVFNHGNHARDFTYVDDIVEGVIRASDRIAEPDPEWRADAPNPARSNAPYRVLNIGNGAPVLLDDFITAIEDKLGRKAQRILMDRQPGDVAFSHADVSDLAAATGYRPTTPVRDGIARFVDWYREYYGV